MKAMCANLTYQIFQADSKGTQPVPDDLAVVLPIHIVEKSQSKLFTKNLAPWKKKNPTQTKHLKKVFLAAPKKIRYDLWTVHQHTHGWNFKQLIFQTNNSNTSTCASPKPSSLRTLTKSYSRRIAVQTALQKYRTKAGDKSWTKALFILKICLRKLWVLANKHDFCLQSWQKIQSTY